MAKDQPSGQLTSFATDALSIETAAGTALEFTVEIAESPEQRAQGLMFRRQMAADAGMLFLFGGSRERAMWMKNTFIPLDMLFIDERGKIVRIEQRTVPQSLRTIVSGGPAFAVLELNAGTASRLGIKPGDRVIYPAFN
ncbi:MAG: DUF192 domain-containing protein [Kiloniellaceae bacterium]